jgi:hypothetical protein
MDRECDDNIDYVNHRGWRRWAKSQELQNVKKIKTSIYNSFLVLLNKVKKPNFKVALSQRR